MVTDMAILCVLVVVVGTATVDNDDNSRNFFILGDEGCFAVRSTCTFGSGGGPSETNNNGADDIRGCYFFWVLWLGCL